MKRVHVTVEGRVQGVGYRYATRSEALRIGVTGWVRNLADGRVEAEIEGTDAQVDELLTWMRTGPAWARVHAIRETETAPTGATGFEVRADG
ncbi:acylphosphatase [Microbacterium sp. No. 7]|uniref:acylphosphatase n=1 Tax=Microbacterium sp. No. 7 TaxID=1714373 RepID=UPI000AAAC354|nr:acylphosphatase [Microbacterium sp. No. 7]